MARYLTEADARRSLNEHARAKGRALHERFGPAVDPADLHRILEDREFARYPCSIVFDADALKPGECAYPSPRSERPEEGFDVYVHPLLAPYPEWVLYVVFYQLVVINYGNFASSADAEAFGAAALGLPEDQYYDRLCALADAVRAADTGAVVALPDPEPRRDR